MEEPSYKEELLRLVAEKKIKHTAKYIENATDETLITKATKITKARQESDEVNEKVTGVLITKLSELMVNLDLVKDNVTLEDDLAKNELFKRDVKRVIGYLTPYVPMVGLVSGGITVGAHVADKKLNSKEEPEKTS